MRTDDLRAMVRDAAIKYSRENGMKEFVVPLKELKPLWNELSELAECGLRLKMLGPVYEVRQGDDVEYRLKQEAAAEMWRILWEVPVGGKTEKNAGFRV